MSRSTVKDLPITTIRITPDMIATVTPEQAQLVLDQCYYSKQRPVNLNVVKRYADLIRAGEFGLSVGWIADVGDNHGLVDMQHRLQGCIEAGLPFQIIVIQTQHETEEERDEIYANRDRGKDRTPADYIRAHGHQLMPSLEQAEVNKVATAVSFLATGFHNNQPTSSRPGMQDIRFRVRMAAPYERIASKYFDAIREARNPLRNELYRARCVALGLATIEHVGAVAEDFWQTIARNENLKKETGPWWMATNVLVPKQHPATDNLRFLRAAAKCWNTFHEGKVLPRLRVTQDDEDRYIELRGTPYTQRALYIPDKLLEVRSQISTPPGPSERKRRGRPRKERPLEEEEA
jgi:hypothetical protein